MARIKWWLKLCALFFRMNIQSIISLYRWSFITVYISSILGYFSTYVVIWATMRMFNHVNGWNVYEVIFLYSLSLLSYSLAQTFLQPFWNMDELMARGGLDEYLIRPANPLFLLITRRIVIEYIAHISISFGAILFSLKMLHISWGLVDWGLFIITVTGATLIQSSITIIPPCLSFWVIRSDQLSSLVRNDMRSYIGYPISIYPKFVRVVLTVIIPFAFVNYYPAFRLIRNVGLDYLMKALPLLTLAVGVLLIALAYFVWNLGLRQYKSSGS